MCAVQTDRPLAINNYHSLHYKNQHLVYCIENKGKWFAVTTLDGSTSLVHEYMPFFKFKVNNDSKS